VVGAVARREGLKRVSIMMKRISKHSRVKIIPEFPEDLAIGTTTICIFLLTIYTKICQLCIFCGVILTFFLQKLFFRCLHHSVRKEIIFTLSTNNETQFDNHAPSIFSAIILFPSSLSTFKNTHFKSALHTNWLK